MEPKKLTLQQRVVNHFGERKMEFYFIDENGNELSMDDPRLKKKEKSNLPNRRLLLIKTAKI